VLANSLTASPATPAGAPPAPEFSPADRTGAGAVNLTPGGKDLQQIGGLQELDSIEVGYRAILRKKVALRNASCTTLTSRGCGSSTRGRSNLTTFSMQITAILTIVHVSRLLGRDPAGSSQRDATSANRQCPRNQPRLRSPRAPLPTRRCCSSYRWGDQSTSSRCFINGGSKHSFCSCSCRRCSAKRSIKPSCRGGQALRVLLNIKMGGMTVIFINPVLDPIFSHPPVPVPTEGACEPIK